MEGPQDHGAVANSDASSLLGGWSFRKDNLSRSLSHFVSLWDGDPTSIDRRNPRLSGWKDELSSSSFHPPGRAQGKRDSSKAAGPGKNTAPKTRPSGPTVLQKPEHRVPQPNGNSAHQETPAAQAGDTHKDRWEYEQARNKSPERIEYQRLYAQKRLQRGRELGKCRDCSKAAIPGKTRCTTCAEKHRVSRRRSNATRRKTTGEALENRGVGT